MGSDIHSLMENADDGDRVRIRLVDDEMRLKREDEIAGFDVVERSSAFRSLSKQFTIIANTEGITFCLRGTPPFFGVIVDVIDI